MKKCTYCGQEYPDDATVCAIDQQPLAPVGQPAAASADKSSKVPVAPAVKPPLMVRLRTLHLYLGCIFAPMLLLFALTGIWQTIGIRGAKWMEVLSAIHMSHGSKGGANLTTPLLRSFIVLMAVAFIFTTLLGILMAVKQGRNRREAYYCLAFGIIFPLLAILIHLVG
jgi:hypothetical protein